MPRKIAYQILLRIDQEQAYSNLLLNQVLKKADLSVEDQGLVTKLVYGTLQYKLYLEYQLAFYVNKTIKKRLKWLLLMSFYQLIFLAKVPAYAIVNEAVLIAKQKSKTESQFVNAVLRRFIKAGVKQLPDDETLAKSIKYSCPDWLIKMWQKHYGDDVTEKILIDSLNPPLSTVRVNTLKTTREALIDQNNRPGVLSLDALIFDRNKPVQDEAFKAGFVTIQDEASQLPARLLAPSPGMRVLDMCAAPGSKTTHLAQLMNNQGMIIANDLYPHKLNLVDAQAKRLGIDIIELRAGDATELTKTYPPSSFDAILLDGPCSGYGVIKRKPEIKYKTPVIDELLPLQAKLLDQAVILLKTDGALVYSTCTLNKKENEYQIDAFLKRHPTFIKIKEQTIFPFEHQSDGFYMAKLVKGTDDEINL